MAALENAVDCYARHARIESNGDPAIKADDTKAGLYMAPRRAAIRGRKRAAPFKLNPFCELPSADRASALGDTVLYFNQVGLGFGCEGKLIRRFGF